MVKGFLRQTFPMVACRERCFIMKAILLLAALCIISPATASETTPPKKVAADAVFQKTLAKLRARQANRFVSKEVIPETARIPTRPEIKGEPTFPSFAPRTFFYGSGYRDYFYTPYYRANLYRGHHYRGNSYRATPHRRASFTYRAYSPRFSVRTSSYVLPCR